MNISLSLLPHHRQIALVTLLTIIAKKYICCPYKDAGYDGAAIEVAVPAEGGVVGRKGFATKHQISPSVVDAEGKDGFDISFGADGVKGVVVSNGRICDNDVWK